jgi:anti-sigma B factor antagonist
MNVDIRKIDDVVVVDFEGSLVVGVADGVISSVVEQLLTDGYTNILINLSKVDYIDSSGLGDLVQSQKLAQRLEGRMKLLSPQDRVRRTLHISNLLPLFEVFEEEQAAIDAFRADTPKTE